ncbi:MAG: peptidase M29 [delta proteobacterium MLS_D]|jgi:aminopeptidase|nr:MAG: peptidase M29 [delta proteobacterium MLS_D]
MATYLTTDHLDKYADVLIWGLTTARTQQFRAGDIVLIRFDSPALELAEMLYGKLIDRGMHVLVRMNPTPRMERDFFGRGRNRQLSFLPPGESSLMESLNGSIYLHAPDSLTHLRDVDSRKIGTALVARKELRDILVTREEQGSYGWTLCVYPTKELAQQAGMSLNRYARRIVEACFLDNPDPRARWNEVYREAMAVKRRLNRLDITSLNIESAGTDLVVTPGRQRKWIGVSGHNIPSFEIFLSPDWRGTRGVYFADQPSFRSGNYVRGARLEFEKGRVRSATAEEGEDFLQKQIRLDPGARRIGEFSLTDRRFSPIDTFMADTLFDENYGGRYGNCHIALGASYSDTYAGNPAELTRERKRSLGFNESAIHWDLVNTEKKIVTARLASGKRTIIYEEGTFTV